MFTSRQNLITGTLIAIFLIIMAVLICWNIVDNKKSIQNMTNLYSYYAGTMTGNEDRP
jgi:hypothetical protein